MSSTLSKYLDPRTLSQLLHAKMSAKYLVEGHYAGQHRSPFYGFAVEFAGHREYVPGDDIKHLDWRVYFKTERLAIKQYEQETNFICHLLIDKSESMQFGSTEMTKLEYAKHLATCLTYLIVRRADAVGLGTFDEQLVDVLPPLTSMSQVFQIAELFENLQPTSKTGIGEVLTDYARRIGRRGIVIIMSDFFGDHDSLMRGIQRLRYDNHEVVLFHILDDSELTFPFEGMTRFIGLETAGDHLTQPENIRQDYLDKMNNFIDTLRRNCDANRVEHVLVNTSVSQGHMLMGYLNSRREMVPQK
jgi:uncharacterized protein (DUF58 family)